MVKVLDEDILSSSRTFFLAQILEIQQEVAMKTRIEAAHGNPVACLPH
jgi:hypothetical protein